MGPADAPPPGGAAGAAALLAASGLFDAGHYAALVAAGEPAQAAGTQAGPLREPPLLHYLRAGWRAGLDPHPAFDVSWYLQTYPDVAEAGVEPLGHYLTDGWRQGRDPSAAFSTRGYLAVHPELLARGTCPLVHHAAVAGRPATAPGPRGTTRLAVALHVFYPDYVRRFADLLARLPRAADVFVAVPDASVRALAEAGFGAVPTVRHLDVRVVPNRGRNFGPLLVEFGEVLAQYDVVGHLHSKKSLYTGGEQRAWADHVLDALVPAPARAEALLSALDRSSDGPFGLVHPVTPPGLPYWANHWLGNHRFAGAVLPPGLPPPTDGFIGYPVGGMFWARTAALRPLLVRGWSYDDFPPEAGQNDGTAHHAVERMVAHVAAAQGYRSLVVEPGSARTWEPLEDVLAAYARTRPELVEPVVRHSRGLVTFDLFETLVQRGTGFADWGKVSLGRRLAAGGLVGSAEEFVAARDRAEAQLAAEAGGRWDATLDQVHARLAALLPTGADPRALAEVEFQDDLGCLRPRDRLPAWFADRVARGLPTAVVTDTYYERARVEQVLGAAGLGTPAAFPADGGAGGGYLLLCSSELGRRKDRGDLWDLVEDLAGGAAGRHGDGSWLHVGDNVRTDVQAVSDRGRRVVHVASPADRWFLTTADRWAPCGPVDAEAEFTGRLVAAAGHDPFVAAGGRGTGRGPGGGPGGGPGRG